MKDICLILVTLFLLSSCNTKKNIITEKNKSEDVISSPRKITSKPIETKMVSSPNNRQTKHVVEPGLTTTENYIAAYSQIAMDEMENYGIPASITLAQAILESGNGVGRLSVEANNHFGIKCHGWKGEKIYHDDDASQECFRKYKDSKYSFRDHSLFLKERKRYYKLFQLEKDDYKNWAKELKKAGYATDPKYPAKLISLIERYNLDDYDRLVLGKESSKVSQEVPEGKITHKVAAGETLYSLSKKYNTSVEILKKINRLETNNLSIGQALIIQL